MTQLDSLRFCASRIATAAGFSRVDVRIQSISELTMHPPKTHLICGANMLFHALAAALFIVVGAAAHATPEQDGAPMPEGVTLVDFRVHIEDLEFLTKHPFTLNDGVAGKLLLRMPRQMTRQRFVEIVITTLRAHGYRVEVDESGAVTVRPRALN
ncbi:MAG: hypothetical protein ACRDAM_13045 [Casimicrobium sp.]